MDLGEDLIWLIIYLLKRSLNDKPIKVFNNGEMERDFTYIDDIVNGVTKIIEKNIDSREHYKIYNIGNNKTESLQDFIKLLKKQLVKKQLKKCTQCSRRCS